MSVLIVHSSLKDDDSIPAVEAHLRADGVPVRMLDSTRYPLSVDLWASEEQGVGVLRTAEGELDPAGLRSVWIRHTQVAADQRERIHEDYQGAVATQSALVLAAWLTVLPCFQLDPLPVLNAAPDGLGQLQLARACGLEVPRSLIGNDVQKAAEFLDACKNGAIIKFFASSASKVLINGEYRYLPTQRVTPELRQNLARLALCPMVLQEEVPKYRELRITVVGRKVFAAAVDPRGSKLGEVDWRQDKELVKTFVPWDLDPKVETSLLKMMDRMGMNFGTCDIIVTPEGRHVFLEINTISFFDFIEDCTGMPISRAVADLLTGKDRPRVGLGA